MNQDHSDSAPKALPFQLPSRGVRFSALECPFESLGTPHEEAAARTAQAWFTRVFGTNAESERLTEARPERLVAGYYPQASLGQLTLANQYFLWVLSLDDLVDETELGLGTAPLAELFTALHSVLHGSSPNPLSTLEVGLSEILRSLSHFATPTEVADFVVANQAYLGALLWEANNRRCDWVPDEISYQLMRPGARAIPPIEKLIAPLNNTRLSLEEKRMPSLVRLAELSGRISSYYNDILSLEKEHEGGEVHNLALVMERSRDLSPQDALSEAISVTNRDVREFVELAGLTRRRKLSVNGQRYIATLESMMKSTLEWTLTSSRYGAADLAPRSEAATA